MVALYRLAFVGSGDDETGSLAFGGSVGMKVRKEEATAGFEDSGDFGQDGFEVRDMLGDEAHHDEVKGVGFEGQGLVKALNDPADVLILTELTPRALDHFGGQVETYDGGTGLDEDFGEPAGSAAEIEGLATVQLT